jgi:hypothetical protein
MSAFTTELSSSVSLTSFMAAPTAAATSTPIPVQIFTVAIGSNPATAAEFADIAASSGGSSFAAADASEIVDSILAVINLPIYSVFADVSSLTEGNSGTQTVTFTLSRDVATDAATVSLALGGTADASDSSGVVTSVDFNIGEREKNVSVLVSGDAVFEADETLSLTLGSVSTPATIGLPTATITIVNDDIERTVVDGTDVGETLPGTPGDDLLDAMGGDDTVLPDGGDDTITLGSGSDTVRGTITDLDGDTVTDLTSEDMIMVTGTTMTRKDMQVTLGSAILDFDGDGDGAFGGALDGRLTLQGDFTNGAFMAARTASDTVITFESFLTSLAEGMAVSETQVNGIMNTDFLRGTNAQNMTITFEAAAGAAFNNTIGMYEIDASGNLINVQILAENAKMATSPVSPTGPSAGNAVGFFLVQDGDRTISDAVFAADSFEFISDGSGGFDLASGGTALSGVEVFFSHDASLNSDGKAHVLSGVSNDANGAMRIGFEDLVRNGLSDDDFQDVLLYVDVA